MSTDTVTERAGVFTAEDLRGAIAADQILCAGGVGPLQIQPASLDLTLGRSAWRVRAAFLPGAAKTVAQRVEAGLGLHRLDLSAGAVLETGCVYLVELREALALPPTLSARVNPKSSTGRIDVFVRLVTDRGIAYDQVPSGYTGPLYAEITPRTFSVLVREGSSLNQLRVRHDESEPLTDNQLTDCHADHPLLGEGTIPDIAGGLRVSVDLTAPSGVPIGYRARRHSGLIDVDKVGALNPADYWEPIFASGEGLILDPDEFYILASAEELCIPHHLAAEMVPIDTDLGAFRVHYAGFFDPGFGVGVGSRAVLEVRGYDAPFLIEHGQTLARLVYEPLTHAPSTVYGQGLSSNYQGQGLRLSKHFAAG